MKRAIRILAICDLLLSLPLVLLSQIYIEHAYCSSPGKCFHSLSIFDQVPEVIIVIVIIIVYIILLALLAAGFTLSLVVTTLSMVLHNRRGSRGWFAVFVILTSILTMSPGLLYAGVLRINIAYDLLLVLAALSSLVALVSTSFLGEGDENS